MEMAVEGVDGTPLGSGAAGGVGTVAGEETVLQGEGSVARRDGTPITFALKDNVGCGDKSAVVRELTTVDNAWGADYFQGSAMAVEAIGEDAVVKEVGGGEAAGVAVFDDDGPAVEAVVVAEQAVGDDEGGRRGGRGGAAVEGSAAVGGVVVEEEAVADMQGGAAGEDGPAGVAVVAVGEDEAVDGGVGEGEMEQGVGSAAVEGDASGVWAAVAAIDIAARSGDGGQVGGEDDGAVAAEGEGEEDGVGDEAGIEVEDGFAQGGEAVGGIDGVERGGDEG